MTDSCLTDYWVLLIDHKRQPKRFGVVEKMKLYPPHQLTMYTLGGAYVKEITWEEFFKGLLRIAMSPDCVGYIS